MTTKKHATSAGYLSREVMDGISITMSLSELAALTNYIISGLSIADAIETRPKETMPRSARRAAKSKKAGASKAKKDVNSPPWKSRGTETPW